MGYIFRPPTVSEGPIGEHRLFQFYQQDRGVTVMRFGTEFIETRFPSEDDIAVADNTWIGGQEHIVDDAVAAMLIDAGYGDNLELM